MMVQELLHIGRVRDGSASGGANLRSCILGRAAVRKIVHDDRGAFFGQACRDRKADAAARSRDDRNAILQPHDSRSLMSDHNASDASKCMDPATRNTALYENRSSTCPTPRLNNAPAPLPAVPINPWTDPTTDSGNTS